MFFKPSTFHEAFVTLLTLEGFLSFMNLIYMSLDPLCSLEVLLTLRTFGVSVGYAVAGSRA